MPPTIEELDARLKTVETDVVVLKEHDQQVDGVLLKVNNLILNNPKVVLLCGMALSAAIAHFSTKAVTPEVAPAPIPINIHLPADGKKDDPKKAEPVLKKGGWQ